MFNLGGIFILFAGVTIFRLNANVISWYLYKKEILTVDLSRERPGGHATTQLLHSTVTGTTGVANGVLLMDTIPSRLKDGAGEEPAGHGDSLAYAAYNKAGGRVRLTPLTVTTHDNGTLDRPGALPLYFTYQI